MKAQILHIYLLRSQRVLLIMLLIFGLSLTIFYSFQQESGNPTLKALDLLPVLYGLIAAIGVSGIQAQGTYSYYLIRFPARIIVFTKAILGSVLYYLSVAALSFIACCLSAVVVLVVRHNSVPWSEFAITLIRFVFLVLIFCVFGCALAFIGQSVALSIIGYIVLVWVLPIALAFLTAFNVSLGQSATGYTLAVLAVNLEQSTAFVSIVRTTLFLVIWLVAGLLAGYWRFSRSQNV